MSKQMLIDAVHPEETRVALVNDGRVEDFDFETTGSEQLRGNIYLAKVTRVEPSLQACFVEYGGNRHGFLAFGEIHPDYYQLPQEDRDALLEEAAREAAASDDDFDDGDDEGEETESGHSHVDTTGEFAIIDEDDDDDTDDDEDDTGGEEPPETRAKPAKRASAPRNTRSSAATRRYKIQEVIRRRQVLLVQVVKEERGNKGAALTTFLSLAGRYSVLMPNTPRGGGISRKIPSGTDRKRLKSIMDSLSMPKGMGLIVRTAGAKRTDSEIRRDYDYLQSLWGKIRSKTLDSMAPALIHEEGGLVHRAMRDMFDREITEVIVHGEDAYREAKDLAKILMPNQARKVMEWTSPVPLFVAEGIEDQLESIFNPVVQMKSGGYLVINQTEALVAIDVNSGKSTKERSIEQTALRTNLEAAEEACRQMRLRDLAGLVVIDFIDMDENKNNRAVEKKMKDSLRLDRARVQNSRISQFGLMEISRQRRRAGVMQATSAKCEACDGTGRRRSISSSALQLLRAVEARIAGGGLSGMTITAPTDVALYLLNSKRDEITAIEDEAGFTIAIKSSAAMIPGDFDMNVDKDAASRRGRKVQRSEFLRGDPDDELLPEPDEDDVIEAADEDEDEDEGDAADEDADTSEAELGSSASDDDDGSGRKRRRRGRRGGRRRKREAETIDPGAPPSDGGALLDGLAVSSAMMLEDEPPGLPDAVAGGLGASVVASLLLKVPATTIREDAAPPAVEAEQSPAAADERKKRKRRRRRRGRPDGDGSTAQAIDDAESDDEAETADDDLTEAEEASVSSEDLDTPAPSQPEPDLNEPTLHEPASPPSILPEVEVATRPSATEPVLETANKVEKKKRGWWSR